MDALEFQSDCDHCFGLCCVALAFSRSDDFGHDKLAGEPCFHLDAKARCSIHARREDLGYEGCEAFECLGAGQRASAVFAAQNWRRDSAIARRMHARFALLLQLQEMRRALSDAASLDLAAPLEAERQALLEQIALLADSHDGSIDAESSDALAQARNFMAVLKRLPVH